jgi:prevent-host-death family protein
MKVVRIAEFKARLSEYLRIVRRGNTLVIQDRETPVARVVPYSKDAEGLVIREPLGAHANLQSVPLPPPLQLGYDVLDLLLEERQGDR